MMDNSNSQLPTSNSQGESVLTDRSSVSAELKAIVEALIFASPEPLTPKMLFKLLADEPKEDVTATIAALKADYESRPGPAVCRGGGRLPDRHAAGAARVGAPPLSTSARRRS